MRLENKVAIVTGAGSGFGEGIAVRFAQEGAKVVVNDINTTAGERVADAIRKAGGEAEFVRADVTRAADWAQLVTVEDVPVWSAGVFEGIPVFSLGPRGGRLDVLHPHRALRTICYSCKRWVEISESIYRPNTLESNRHLRRRDELSDLLLDVAHDLLLIAFGDGAAGEGL